MSRNPLKSGSTKPEVARSPLWRGAREAFAKRIWNQSKGGPDCLQIKA